mgnify:CR=1 FL=1|tara:strand:+ start:314 stop:511 length:198 start_codon:yes stop_codon:yes gene_type:complete
MSKETKTYTVLWTETITNIATVEAKSDADLYSKWGNHTYQDQRIETSDYNEGSFQVLKIDNKPIN